MANPVAAFVAGAGTAIGKTLVSAALVHQYREVGGRLRALKPVMSGLAGPADPDCDAAVLLRAGGHAPTAEAIAGIAPWRFAAPLSPHLAAEAEGRPIDFAALCAWTRDARAAGEALLIEGVGGVMTPLTRRETVLDWMAALGLPTILVAGSYLGAMSHALSAATALDARGIALRAVVVSESTDSVGLGETTETLAGFLPRARIVALPRIAGPDPWRRAPRLVEACFGR